ncbi:MAG: hypothetical protein HC850_13645 [Rhodomicrobium sp.]|nr:hypothetical protein [Rhodomicrobium sp.]
MGKPFRILTSIALLFLCAVLAAHPAGAQKRYPPIEEAWDATDYRALVQRIENDGLDLPTLSSGSTKPVFERMVHSDNIPLRMGLNKDLAITIRYQRLEPLLQPLHKLIAIYAKEAEKGKPYATELARLKVYASKAGSALLEIIDPFLATLPKDRRYPAIAAEFDKTKNKVRDIYSELVESMAETKRYSKSDILAMAGGAINALPAYQTILADPDRQKLMKSLSQQIAAAGDPQVKTVLTELRDAIEHKRIKA